MLKWNRELLLVKSVYKKHNKNTLFQNKYLNICKYITVLQEKTGNLRYTYMNRLPQNQNAPFITDSG